MEGKWRKLKNTAFIEELRFKEFNEVIYIISLGKRQLLHMNLGFNFDKMYPGKLKFYKEFSAMCEKSGAFRGYEVSFRCRSYLRELSSLASKIYVFGNPRVFYQDPGVYVGFGEHGGVVRVFYSTIFRTILFVIESDEGRKLVERHEKEIVECVEESRKEVPGVVGGPYIYYLLDEDWVVDFINRYLDFLRREGYEPDAGIVAEVPTPDGTVEVELKEIR